MKKQTDLALAMAKHGITVKSEFVPFSKSRNKDDKDDKKNPRYTLNWKVTLQRNGRYILTTYYSAGVAHCPSYNAKQPVTFDRPTRYWQAAVTQWECENGFKAQYTSFSGFSKAYKPRSVTFLSDESKPLEYFPILPESDSVVYSLIMDSSVLDYASFAQWADEFGYDSDSRKAESIYQDCMKIALQVRAGLGESIMAELRDASQDF